MDPMGFFNGFVASNASNKNPSYALQDAGLQAGSVTFNVAVAPCERRPGLLCSALTSGYGI